MPNFGTSGTGAPALACPELARPELARRRWHDWNCHANVGTSGDGATQGPAKDHLTGLCNSTKDPFKDMTMSTLLTKDSQAGIGGWAGHKTKAG